MQLRSNTEVFRRVSKTVEGRALKKYLQAYLAHLDEVSRKLRGEALSQNTINRDFLADFIVCFEESHIPDQSESTWRE